MSNGLYLYFYSYVIGAYTSWKVQALACGVIPIVCHCLLLLVSESPRFLVEQGQITAASQALAWLYGLKAESLTLEMAMVIFLYFMSSA